jgi:hypothetical protein
VPDTRTFPPSANPPRKVPRNDSRIVIEGIDEPKREGRYSDRIKVDPGTRQWFDKRLGRRRTASRA